MTIEVSTAVACRNVLGEGTYWDARRGRLWWLDVPLPSRLFCLDPASGDVQSYDMPEMITAVRAKKDGTGLIVACHSGISSFDYATGKLTHLLNPEPQLPYNRSNDAGTDARGRFWFGTMQNNIQPNGAGIDLIAGAGTLYRLDPDLTLTPFETGIWVSNTVCWSPDNRTMYFCDTASGVISAYDFDLDDGVVTNKRAFAEFDRGAPDGSCVDAEGYLWNARWDGGCVVRFNPRGEVDKVIDLPVAKVTSCAFAGPDLDQLYITTASYGMSEAERAAAPDAGNLFICHPGVRGQRTAEFG
ncbi:SMP-30/gluconolactonase/LRE family protein [Devosia ginsengisoli]|uniref:SMP-30/gluconolactonase/LRE family protein n=1 Tax=Devosia ginsengisoli TaxID=400770 RepID=A0A5B8LUB4_9HYPH|nr:SMP-30/gluconolactonase/LRE family protein [Devosia ginsengisoli]QDZ11898.1 SMP-30/gluconolactonase/LRE family protein [Devosia ginsengisoli]